MLRIPLVAIFILVVNANDFLSERYRGATLKPISACCDIPEMGDLKPLAECSNPRLPGPCNDVQCVFEKSGFLIDKQTLNKEAYRAHLRQWVEGHKGWEDAVEKAIKDCVDRDLRQYLDSPCKAYDVFTCTGIAMLKKCPKDAWKC
uniref:Odorant binding protein 43 n=1 Tax=Heliconius charithonia TaxID=33434 RepID=A0AA49EZX5_HELCH|nr:odorant binding protein 43 [Heliconius charithonia]